MIKLYFSKRFYKFKVELIFQIATTSATAYSIASSVISLLLFQQPNCIPIFNNRSDDTLPHSNLILYTNILITEKTIPNLNPRLSRTKHLLNMMIPLQIFYQHLNIYKNSLSRAHHHLSPYFCHPLHR